MKNHHVLSILIYFFLFGLFLVNCTTAAPKRHQNNPSKEFKPAPAFIVDGLADTKFQMVDADHPGLSYIGRIDFHDPKAPVFIWQGTQVRARFSGKSIGFRFSNAWGQNFYNVIIDGKIRFLKLNEWGTHDYQLAQTLSEGSHEFVLFKRTEANSGNAVFRGLILGEEAKLEAKPDPLPLRIEFYGDSITAGACNENPPNTEQYDDLSTHNNYLSYGAITARNLNAEYVCIAVSGIGICYSWNSFLMPEVYNRLYLNTSDERYNFKEENRILWYSMWVKMISDTPGPRERTSLPILRKSMLNWQEIFVACTPMPESSAPLAACPLIVIPMNSSPLFRKRWSN